MFVAETAYLSEQGRYGSFSEIGYALAGTTNRYTYRSPAALGGGASAGSAGIDYIPCGAPAACVNPADGASGSVASLAVVSPPTFTASAVANLDSDTTIDGWAVNDIKGGLLQATPDDVTM